MRSERGLTKRISRIIRLCGFASNLKRKSHSEGAGYDWFVREETIRDKVGVQIKEVS